MNELKGKHYLVTGGAGFIGSNLTGRLLENGCRVTVVDNFATGKRENLAEFARLQNFELVTGDIRDRKLMPELCCNVDGIFQLAALGSVPRSVADPVESISVNVEGFVNVLHSAALNQVPRVVYASSSSVYGDNNDDLKTEFRTGRPLSPYAAGKQADELLAGVFARLHKLDIIGLRFFNVFGPKQDSNGAYAAVVPKFIKLLLAHQSPVINGDGSAARDFTYVENVIQANILSMLRKQKFAPDTVCNVALGGSITVLQLAQELKKILAEFDSGIAGVELKFAPPRPGDIKYSRANVNLAAELLGFCGRISFADGLKRTAKWYASNNLKG